MMPLSRCGANASVAMKVTSAAMPSCLLACQACLTAPKLTSPITAMMMIAASTACGRWYSSGVRNSSVSSTNSAVITELRPVLAPEFMFTAERENEPDTGKACVRLPTMLASPWPISSWLGSMRSLVLAAMALAMEIASMKPTSEITRAADSRLPNASRLKLGICTLGRPSGMPPTTSPPPSSLKPLALSLRRR